MLVKIIDAAVFAVVVVIIIMPRVEGDPQETLPTPNALPATRICPKNLVFDNTAHNDAANFHRTLKGLANFMHTT